MTARPTWAGTAALLLLVPPAAACVLVNLPAIVRGVIGGAP